MTTEVHFMYVIMYTHTCSNFIIYLLICCFFVMLFVFINVNVDIPWKLQTVGNCGQPLPSVSPLNRGWTVLVWLHICEVILSLIEVG